MLLCAVLGSEAYQNYLTYFTAQFRYIDIWMEQGSEEIAALLMKLADEEGCNVFCVSRMSCGAYDVEITIYADSDTEDLLRSRYYISEGSKNSIFSGTTSIRFMDFSEIADGNEKTVRFYFMGTEGQISAIRTRFNNSFAASYWHKEAAEGNEWIVRAVWGAAFLLLLVLTWLDIQFGKKKRFILISLGKRPLAAALEGMGADAAVFTMQIVALYLILNRFVYVMYCFSAVLLFFILFLVFNSLMYLTLLKIDYKEVIYGANITVNTLAGGYVLKTLIMILATAALAVNINLIVQNGKYLTYYNDINTYENRVILSLIPDGSEEDGVYGLDFEYLESEIFLEYYAQGKALFSFEYATDSEDDPVLLLGGDAEGLISDSTLLSQISGNAEFHVFVPENKADLGDEELALSCAAAYFDNGNGEYSCEVIYYTEADILYFDFREDVGLDLGFEKAGNLIFVYCTLSEERIEEALAAGNFDAIGDRFINIIFDLEEGDLENILETDGISSGVQVTLADECGRYRSVLIRKVLLCSVVCMLLILLELIMIFVITRLEYTVNAKELAVKKVLGYSTLSKNRDLFLLDGAGAAVSIAVMIIFSLMFGVTKVPFVLSAGFALAAAEAILVFISICRFERTNISKILKGGSL